MGAFCYKQFKKIVPGNVLKKTNNSTKITGYYLNHKDNSFILCSQATFISKMFRPTSLENLLKLSVLKLINSTPLKSSLERGMCYCSMVCMGGKLLATARRYYLDEQA